MFSATGNLAAFTRGGNITLSGVNIGTVSSVASGNLILTLNANATQARVNETLQSIAYSNSSDSPPTSVDITWEFYDGNSADAQGTCGQLTATGSTTVNITAVNDAPVVDLNGTNDIGTNFSVSFTEDGGAVNISDTDIIISDADSTSFQDLYITLSLMPERKKGISKQNWM